MLTKIVDLARLILDPETRRTIAAVRGYLQKGEEHWKITAVQATFKANAEHEVRVFASSLILDIKSLGLPEEVVEDTRLALKELVANALQHGCSHGSRGRIRIRAAYSPWFIRIEVSDTGKGFNLDKVLAEADLTGEQRGLQVIRRIAYRLKTNKKGNAVTVFIAGHKALSLPAEPEA